MSQYYAQEIDLSDYSGRIFVVGDLHGCFRLFCQLLDAIGIKDGEDAVVIATGNLFDNCSIDRHFMSERFEEPLSMMKAINNRNFSGKLIKFYSVKGAGEQAMIRALPTISAGNHKFVHNTFLREMWRKTGGGWHDYHSRYLIDNELKQLITDQLPLLYKVKLKNGDSLGVVSAELPLIRDDFDLIFSAFSMFDSDTANLYLNTCLYGSGHIPDCTEVKGIEALICGMHRISDIRKTKRLKRSNRPVCLGNTIFLNSSADKLVNGDKFSAISMLEILPLQKLSMKLYQLFITDGNIIRTTKSKFNYAGK